MRAIKREKMDEKVLVRLKNMLAAAEAEKSLIPLPSKEEMRKKKKKEENGEVEMAEEPVGDASTGNTIIVFAVIWGVM